MYATPNNNHHDRTMSSHQTPVSVHVTPINDLHSPYNGSVVWSMTAMPVMSTQIDTLSSSDSEVEYAHEHKQIDHGNDENSDTNSRQHRKPANTAISARKYISASKSHKPHRHVPQSANVPKRGQSVDARSNGVSTQSPMQPPVQSVPPHNVHGHAQHASDISMNDATSAQPGVVLDVDAFLSTLAPSSSSELLHTKLSAMRLRLQQFQTEHQTQLSYSSQQQSSIMQLEAINHQLHTNTKNLEEHIQFLLQRNTDAAADSQPTTTLKQLRGLALEQAVHKQHELSQTIVQRDNDIRQLQHKITTYDITQHSIATAQTDENKRLCEELEQLRAVSNVTHTERNKQHEQHSLSVQAYQQQIHDLQQQLHNEQQQHHADTVQLTELTQQHQFDVEQIQELQSEVKSQHDNIIAQQYTIDTQNESLLSTRDEVSALKHQISSNNSQHVIDDLRAQHDRELASLVDIHAAEVERLRKQLLTAQTEQFASNQPSQLQQRVNELQQQLAAAHDTAQQQHEQYRQLQIQYKALQLNTDQTAEQYDVQVAGLQHDMEALKQRNADLHNQILDMTHSMTHERLNGLPQIALSSVDTEAAAMSQQTIKQLQALNNSLTANQHANQTLIQSLQQQNADMQQQLDKFQQNKQAHRMSLDSTTQRVLTELKNECVELSKLNETLLVANTELKNSNEAMSLEHELHKRQLDNSERQRAMLQSELDSSTAEVALFKQTHSSSVQYEDKSQHLTNRVAALTNQMSEQTSALLVAEQRTSTLQQQLLAAQSHSVTHDELNSTQRKLQQQNAELQKQLLDIQSERTNKIYLNNSEHELVMECERCLTGSQSGPASQQDESKLKQYATQIDQLNAANDMLQKQYDTLLLELKQQKQQLADSQYEMILSKQREQSLNDRYTSLRAELNDAQQSQTQSSDSAARNYSAKVRSLQTQLDDLSIQLQAAQHESKVKGKMVTELQHELTQRTDECTSHQSRVKQVTAQLSKVNTQHDELGAELSKQLRAAKQADGVAAELRIDLQQTQQQLQNIMAAHKQCSTTIETLTSNLSASAIKVTRTEQKFQQLQSELLQAQMASAVVAPITPAAALKLDTSVLGSTLPTRTVSLPASNSHITLHITAAVSNDGVSAPHTNAVKLPVPTPAPYTAGKPFSTAHKLLSFDSDDDVPMTSPVRSSREVAGEFNSLYQRLNTSSKLLNRHTALRRQSQKVTAQPLSALSKYMDETDSDDDVVRIIQGATHERPYAFIHAQSAVKPDRQPAGQPSTGRKHARMVNSADVRADKRRSSGVGQVTRLKKHFMTSPISAPDLVDRSHARVL